MIPAFATAHITVYAGDVREALRALPAESVDCVVTSPPYWGLRDYGVAGQIGLERTPPEFVAVMVDVFREVRRVLRSHGTLWLNLGDSYANQGGPGWQGKNGQRADRRFTATRESVALRDLARHSPDGLKPKDMVGIPWRVAFALQADGWYLRSDIVWSKPNPMPESVTDRPTKAHEYVFLLAKSERYFYDAAAIAEPLRSSVSDLRKMAEGLDRIGGRTKIATDPLLAASANTHVGQKRAVGNLEAARRNDVPTRTNDHRGSSIPWEETPGVGRNARSVWEIATQAYPEAHFATFPEELPRRCIKAGCPEQVCSTCGKARERVTTLSYTNPGNRRSNGRRSSDGFRDLGVAAMASGQRLEREVETTGWTDCGHGTYTPGVVLDPFAGSGTTLAVARDLGRRSIGIELNPEYVRLIEKRSAQLAMEFTA